MNGLSQPENRMFHSAVAIDKNKMIVFGGRKGPSQGLNDFWLLDTELNDSSFPFGTNEIIKMKWVLIFMLLRIFSHQTTL